MYSLLKEHIKTNLRRRGYNPENASIEFIPVKDAGNTLSIPAYNEFYYLDVQSVPASLIIESDTHSFTSNDAISFATDNTHKFHEFSGLIEITQAVPVNLQFIRVIPEETFADFVKQ